MTDTMILKELKAILKYSTDETVGTVDYDTFAKGVMKFMNSLEKRIKKESVRL